MNYAFENKVQRFLIPKYFKMQFPTALQQMPRKLTSTLGINSAFCDFATNKKNRAFVSREILNCPQ